MRPKATESKDFKRETRISSLRRVSFEGLAKQFTMAQTDSLDDEEIQIMKFSMRNIMCWKIEKNDDETDYNAIWFTMSMLRGRRENNEKFENLWDFRKTKNNERFYFIIYDKRKISNSSSRLMMNTENYPEKCFIPLVRGVATPIYHKRFAKKK